MAQIEFVKTVKPIGNTGHITIPKKYIGKRAKIIIENQEDVKKEILNLLNNKNMDILDLFYKSKYTYSDVITAINELEKDGSIKIENDIIKLK